MGNRLLHVIMTCVKCLHLLRRWESKLALLREPRLQYHSTKETRRIRLNEYNSRTVVSSLLASGAAALRRFVESSEKAPYVIDGLIITHYGARKIGLSFTNSVGI